MIKIRSKSEFVDWGLWLGSNCLCNHPQYAAQVIKALQLREELPERAREPDCRVSSLFGRKLCSDTL
ncbi:unnamed protein product [Linum trigynum]|uniref:Uncharacterized protein n=1 Tax=Linum trigynum TaxID=586398 RepID=A0AAV2FET7_9ROSI